MILVLLLIWIVLTFFFYVFAFHLKNNRLVQGTINFNKMLTLLVMTVLTLIGFLKSMI